VQGSRRQCVSPKQCRQTVLQTVRDAEAHARPLSPFSPCRIRKLIGSWFYAAFAALIGQNLAAL
jgi:hypothetical protein